MGLLSFLFSSGNTVTIQIEIERKHYEALQVLVNSAKAHDPDFDEGKFLSKLIGDWVDKNWGQVVKKMVDYNKPQKSNSRKKKIF